MKTPVACAEVAAGSRREAGLTINSHPRSITVPVTTRATQSKGEPMIPAARPVEEQDRGAAKRCDHNVDPAIVIDISKRCAPRSPRRGNTRVGPLKMSVLIESEQWKLLVAERSVDLLNIVEHVALRDKKVFPSIVIKVFETHAPPGTPRCEGAQAGFETLVAEPTVAVIVIQTIELVG